MKLKMKLVNQPKQSRLCGHCCVAMIANISLKESIQLIGHKDGTTTKILVDVLNKLGIETGSKLTRFSSKTPPEEIFSNGMFIVKVKYPLHKRNWHWVLIVNGKLFDPSTKNTKISYIYKKRNGIICSYLKIYKRLRYF